MNTIRQIDTDTEHGRLLLVALSMLSSSPGFTHLGPDDILAKVTERAEAVFPEAKEEGP